MRLLITGIAGFAGSHFAEYALSQGVEVWGSLRPGSDTEHIEHLRDRLHLVECELLDEPAVGSLVAMARPDLVAHLAAQSSAAASWRAPGETLAVNVLGQANVLEAVRKNGLAPRILVVGSAEEYGAVEEHELPIAETAPLRPLSPYALSKVAQDLMGYQYFKAYGFQVVRARPFNHEGPRHADAFVVSSFARQIAEIEAGRRPPVVEVGDLTAERDFTDVRDVVRAYWLLLTRGRPGEVYNVCSGKAWRLADVLDLLIAKARVGGIEVRPDPGRVRPVDVPVLRGDPSRLRATVGWDPEIPFEQTLQSVLEYWRRRVSTARGKA